MTDKKMKLSAAMLAATLLATGAVAQEQTEASAPWLHNDPLETIGRPLDQLRQHAEPSGLFFELGFTCIFQGASDTADGQRGTGNDLRSLLPGSDLHSVQLTPDLQVILDPADNAARDVLVVCGLRVQIIF